MNQVNEMMSLRDPSKYAKFEEIEEDDIHIKEDDSESTSRTHDNERDDKEQTNSNTRVLSKSTVPVEASVDIDDSDDNTDFDLANFDSIFEDALWEIELTDSVSFFSSLCPWDNTLMLLFFSLFLHNRLFVGSKRIERKI